MRTKVALPLVCCAPTALLSIAIALSLIYSGDHGMDGVVDLRCSDVEIVVGANCPAINYGNNQTNCQFAAQGNVCTTGLDAWGNPTGCFGPQVPGMSAFADGSHEWSFI